MGTTADKLNKLLETKAAIKQAIIDKGVTVTDTIPFSDYANMILNIPDEERFMLITSDNTNYSHMFRQKRNMTGDIDLTHWRVTGVTAMEYMFYVCINLTGINLSNWDVVKLTNASNMFYSSGKLTNINLSNWDVPLLQNLSYMFYGCEKLISLDLSSWKNANAINQCNGMFQNCKLLENLDISSLYLYDTNFSSSSLYTATFKECRNLTNFNPPAVIGIPLDLSTSPLLTHESIMKVLNNLMETTTSKTLTLGATNLAKLTDEEKAIATNKGWTLA